LIHPFFLWCARSTLTGALLVQTESHRRRPASSPRPCFRSCVPGTPLKVTVLAPPLFSPVSHLLARNYSPEYPPARRELPSTVWPPHPPFAQNRPRHRVRTTLPNLSSYPNQPLAPQETQSVSPSAMAPLCPRGAPPQASRRRQNPLACIQSVQLQSDGPISIRPDLILTARSGSEHSPLSPSPAPCDWDRLVRPSRPRPLTPLARWSVTPSFVRARSFGQI
jgi:hypothetical protein